MKRLIITGIIACMSFLMMKAQNAKQITLSAENTYTDHISLSADSRDMDLMVKFRFDEEQNQLTVTLLTYRSLFVFHNDVRYKTVFKHGKLNAMQLPYVVSDESSTTIFATRGLRKQFPKPRKKFVFKRWMSYEGLQPIPQDYQLVNDFIEQTFEVLRARDEVKLSLRHLMIMDVKKKIAGKNIYLLNFLKDLNRSYHITLQRNPCFGKEDEIALAQHSVEAIRQGYETMQEKYGNGKLCTQAQGDQFNEMKKMLLCQYPVVETNQSCERLRGQWEIYNAYIDSISSARCKVIEETQREIVIGVEPELLYSKARQLDGMVTRWLASTDAIERRDLQLSCLKLVQEVHEWVSSNGLGTEEQQRSWRVFQSAENYYQRSMVNDKGKHRK